MTLKATPVPCPDGSIRPLAESDLPPIEQLSRQIYKVNRSHEAAIALELGVPALVKEDKDGIAGCLILGPGGYGLARSEDDALALAGESAARFPEQATFNCPLSMGSLYRKALKLGCRAIEMHTLMTLGPYQQPEGIWMPSGVY